MEWMADPSITRYNLPMIVPFSKKVSLEKLAQAFQRLFDARPVLRTCFVLDSEGMPRQYSNPDMVIPIGQKQMTEEEVKRYIEQDFVRPYDLLCGEPLCRIELVSTEEKNYALFEIHHIIADGMTLAPNLTINDLPAAYNGEPLAETDYGMYEAAEEEQASLHTEAYERSKAWYAERFGGQEFTTFAHRTANPLGNSIHEDEYLDQTLLDNWCQQQGTSVNLLLMAAFSYVLSEASREEQVIYRTINHGRMDKRLLTAYGMFVKSAPVLTHVDRGQKVIDFIKGFRRELMSSIRYGNYPFNHFCQDLHLTGGVEFGFQGYAIQEYLELEGEKAYAYQLDRGQSTSDLTCIIYLRNGQYDIRLSSSDALNSREDLKRLAKAIRATTENMMAQPEEVLAHLSMMDAEDAKTVQAFRFTAKADVPWKLFYQPIEQNAIRYADRKALVAKDCTLTFAELNTEANRVAHALMRRGLKQGDRVVLLLPRTSAVIVSMFGVSKAGAAYIPCDPAYPSDRINLIVNDSEAPYIITTQNLASDYPAEKVILVEEIYGPQSQPQPGDEENPNLNVSPDDLAYLIYTSGSTGRPKGVMLRHVGITNYLYDHPANVHIHGLTQLGVKTFVSITTLSFDMSLKEFAGSLFNGITSVLADELEVLDASLLADLMNRTGAEAINGTCSRMLSYMELPAFCEALSHCKAVWSGGEKYPMQLLTSLQSMGVHIFNTYGPTEITVSSNIADLTHARKVTVGHPLLNYEEFIVDPWGNQLPVGFTGELLIGGPGVARGYNNLPEMTAERFVEYAGIRVYRSGDLARWEPDGDVEILGRNDGQVKLRGFRIELGEVENLSVKFPGIRQTVADVKDIGTTQHLCLYYVSDDTVDEDALKTFIASSLTEYMVPSVYMRIDAIPLTPNGKTNRKALPVPTLKLDEVVAPATPMEQSILQLVYDLLQLSDFGVTNDLIALGLSSLASMRLSATLKKQLGVQVLMKDIMKHPTVREIAAMAEGSKETITLQPYERREWYPLNESQRGMYVDWMMNPDALQYNIPILLHFRGIDEHQVKDSLIAVANAHPYMKVRLAIKGDDVVQLRQDDATVEVTIEQLDHMPDRLWFQTHVKPFDLLNDPLYRFNIFTYADHVFLLLDLHHIISDGSSNYVIAKELEKAYRGEVLTPETYTAYDRALDEEALMKSERKQEAEDYFDALVGGLEATVYPHSSKTDGERKQGVVDVYVTSTDIDAFCKKQALPTSSFFLAVFHQVLERITREESTLVYFISNGRSELLLDNFFGVLVKTLPSACSQFKGQMADVVRGLNTQMQETIRNDFYPFTKLVERHDLKAEILYNYFVDLQTEVCLGGHQSEEIYGLDWDMAKTPLSITMLRADDGVGYTARIEYDATLYSRQDMEVLGNSFKAFAESCCTAAGNEIANCRIVLPEEYDQLIQLSKGKTMPVDPNETFVSIFMEQAAKTPDAMAVIDEDNSGQSQSAGYTYRQLDQLSNALATELRSLGVGDENTPSPFVSIMLGYEKAFLVAAIGVEKAGGAYVPLDYEYPNDRLLYMLEDSESQVLITSHAIFNEKSSEGDNFTAKNILFIDDFLSSVQGSGFRVNDSQANHEPLTMNHEPVNFATPDRLAYMIYTSGSTGKPKGVMIPHRAKANFVRFIAKEWHHTAQSRICCHSSFSFDASIEDLYPVLTVGGTLYTVPKEARKDLVMLYDFIIKNKITGGCYTTQLGLMLLQQFPDLPVDYLVVGGEKMADNPDCQCRLINTYGPTEFTVDATFYETEHGRDYKNIPIGRPLYNLSAFVTDPTGNLVPQGVPGELCMAGPQIARGYWKREDLTAEKFVDCPFMEGKMYHTGDLVKYNSEGQIEYMGRIDNQVKLRGFRIELGEIETLISKYDGIRMQSVQVKEMGGVQHLCAYYTADRPIDTNALRDYLAEQLTDYMVPTAYMQLDEMPLTPNGKVNTKALPNPSAQTEELVAPVTKTEKELFKLTAEMLKHDKFGITSNLISMGLTSLTAMRFTVGVFNTFGVQVSVKEVMQHSTIHQMAALIDAKREEEGLTTPTSDSQFWAEGKHYYYPITENQRGVFIDWEMNRDTTQYNVPDVVVMKDADAARLRDALEVVVNAHPYLKTRFVQHDGDVMQIRRDEEPVEILTESLSKEPDTAFFQDRVRPFDLYHDRLYRLEIYTFQKKAYLFMDIHHSIYDGASSLILLHDIQQAYEGEAIVPETYTAFDFALDELRLMRSEKYDEAGEYFKKLMGNVNTTVYPHSVRKQENDPGMLSMLFNGRTIEHFCQQNGLTLNSYFLAITMHVLHTLTREDDVIITTINNGRSDVRMMNIMGMFVKTIPVVHSNAHSNKRVAEVVKLIQDQLIETQSRDFYPFTKMVELYGLRPEIMYAYQPKDVSQDEEEGKMRLLLNQTKLPLDIQVMPDRDGFVLELQYDTALYAKKDMEQLAAMLVHVAEQAPSMTSFKDIPLLSDEEKEKVLRLSTGKKLDYDTSATWVDLFQQQAKARPDQVAVVDSTSQLTYRELDEKSDRLAHWLVNEGVKPDDFVAIKMDRVKEFLVAVLATQKAGAAYVPIDADYPEDRISYMIENCEARVLLTEETVKDVLDNEEFAAAAINYSRPDRRAYMIYTSGSTGRPKGVIVAHRGLMNLIAWLKDLVKLKPGDKTAIFVNFSFDASVNDLYPILTAGGELHIFSSEMRKDMESMYNYLCEHKIKGLEFTTQLAMAMMQQYELPIDYLFVGGEKLKPFPKTSYDVINVYGPTEFTDISSYYVVDQSKAVEDIPIGRPVPNTMSLIVDPYGRLLPQGFEGELCLAGRQMTYGYWKQDKLTEEKFVDCPFAEGKMYHTGDIARYNDEGNLEYVGRIDTQVKLNGFRIEMGGIENRASMYDGILQVAAEVYGGKLLCLYYTATQKIDEEALKAFLSQTLAEYMVPSVYMQLDVMPMTPNGKVDRKKLPAPKVDVGQIVEADSETEAQMLAIAEELLGGEHIGVTTNLITAGLTSLTAMRMSAVIKQKTQFYIPVKDILLHPTIREMATLAGATREEEPKSYSKQDYYPITENQRGVYIDWEMNHEALQYNIPEVIPMDAYSPEQIHDALVKVMDAHPYLKVHLLMKDNDILQQRRDDAPVVITTTQLNHEPDKTDFEQRVKPFNLLGEDLYRLEIIQSPSKCYLFVDIHHIVNDGVSRLIFSEDLQRALKQETLTPEGSTAYDYALEEKRLLEGEQFKAAEAYFDNMLSGQDSTVYPHSAEPTDARGLGYDQFTIPYTDIDAFCRQSGVTPHAYFATMLSQLLHRVTREENVVFTTIDNGRSDAHWAQSIGMYVKTLPVASTQNMQEIDHVTIADAVKQMHQQLMTTRSYSFYPFTSMVERHHIRPEIMFVYHGNFAPPTSEEAPTDNIVLDLDTAKLPLTVTVYSKGEDYYQVSLEYDLALYSAASMKVLAGMMTAACQSVSESSKLTDIKLMTDAEQEAMVKYSKGKDMDVDITKTFAQVFEERAKLVPDNIAVADKDSHLTYQQLSHYSDVLAHQLIKAGVQPNNFVCVMLDRYKEFPLSVLAIHKAGAAYTPMDFEYPNERLQYMLENSESKVLITTHTVLESKLLEGNFDTGKAQVIFIDDVDFSVQAEPINLTTPDNLAYMIYTSGSTGKPKGAMLHQAGLWNFINIVIDMEKLTANDRIEGHRSFSFDAHIEDMYAILTLGGSFHIMPSEIRKDLSAIRDFLFEHKITGGGYSTAIAALLLNTYDDMPVRFITAGGEKLDGVYSDHIEIINVYGPTECTDDTSYYSIAPGTHAENIPIGKPVANTWNFIVDTTGHLVPRGMVGELCIAGIQVGRGYWRLPERSAQSFVDCPFVGVDRWGRKVHMYHTGDLCRYNENGDLEYMGRIDFQVKLRGFRIELGEIESKVLQMEGVKQAAAEVRKVNDVDHLLLYYTLDNGSALTDDDIRQALESSSLADYMVPDTYMQLDEMPMTPNGKVNRKALPEPVIRRAAEYVEPQNETERVVAQAMQEVLGLQQEVGALDNFFTWGGDSIKCIRLVSRLRSEGITLQVADIMKLKVVRDIAAVCSNGVVEISQDAWSGEVPQTAITSMFFDLKLPKPHHYNQTFFIRAAERVKPEALKQTMAALVNHHDMLRAIVLNNQLFVRDAEEPNLYGWEQMDCTKDADYRENIEAVCRLQQKSVNLANGPLFKVVLFNTPDYDAILMVCHHLVVDGVSWRILLEDFNTAYAQAVENIPIELPAKTHSFREYAETLQEYAHSYNLSQERTYWDAVQKKLLRLPASNDKDNSRMMKDVRSTLDEQTTHSIMTTAGDAYHADINDLLMTALGRSYFKLTGEKAVSVQFEGHGREYIGSDTLMTDRTVGWFTSIYPVVLEHLDGDMRSCLRQTKETMHRVPNKGVGYNVLRYLSADIPVYNTELCALIGFNYLGDMTEQAADGHKPFTAMTEISAGDDISPKNVFGPDLNINCSVVEGKLEATMAFNKALCSEEQARRLLDGMMEELREITIHTTAVKDVEVTATDLGEYEWTDEEFQSVYDHFKGMGTPLQRIYPLSPMQEGMALKFMLEPNSLAYRLLMRMSLDILPTEEQLRYTLDQLGAKHEVLRTSLIYRGVEQYRQAIVDRPLELEMRDVTGAANKESAMVALYRAEQQKGFDMEDQSLFRIICVKTSETTSEILLAVHHIIVDGWCIGLYMSDLIANLTDAVEGRMKPIGQYPTGRYEKFIRELLRKDTDRGLKYWRELLDGYTTKAVIPSSGIVPEQERAVDNVCRITIGGNEMTALKALTARAQATMNTLVELAWGLVLQVYNRQDDVVFVKVVSGRNNASEGVEDVVGLFINSVPVRVRTPKGTTVIEALEMLQHQAAETNEWDFCPLSAIQQQTDLGADLFQSIVAFENYDSGVESKNASAPFHAKMIYAKEESINDLTITAYTEDDSELIVNLEFDPMKYRKSEMEQVKNVMRQMLQNIAESPEADVSSFPPLSKKDCIALVKLGMGETLSYDSKQTLVDLFTEQARRTPESTCIVFQDKRLTYREVDTMTDRLAVLLQKRYHVQPEMAVGVMIERSELMLIYPMAIMKAGAAYMPLDFHFPAERLSFMCKDAGVKLILSEGNRVAEAMPDYKGKVVTSDVLERLDEVKGVLNQKKARPENMFVILYTSGSTGTPKGVVLEHRNIVNFCHWYVDAFKVTAQDRAVAYANFGFDAHMMDLYPVISVGGSVYIIPSDMRMDLMAMNAYMEQEQLNLAFMTTQVGYMFATTIENKSLRLLSVGGEKLQPLAKPAFDFYNGYGPTECTLYSTFYHIDRDYDSSYIGRPLAGYQLYVVDPNMNLVPQGAMGELVVAGAGVGRGYLNRPDQNAEKFITFMGQKAYRTGDLVKWSPDGNIDFIGRIDGQVKLRGLRIEMGEIEACVLKYSHIKTTAVDVKEICGAQHICCYFTADEQIDVESLREFLTGKLADYMVPTAYMQMEKLPLTPNGKVNRRALPVPTITLQTENVAPRTEKEQVLFDIAKELLKLDDFGVTDDLTKLGLTSLLAIKMVMMATKRNLSIKLDDLMKLKTIRATLQHEMTMLSWVTPYEESKPVVVLVCGATPYKDMEPYVELLSKHYSVLVFEPIGEHYDYIFQDDNINEVVEMYYALLDLTLPRGVKVSAFTGHCFGGEIAYRMAIKWEKDTGETVPMVMLDVFWRVDPLHFDEEALMKMLPQPLIDKYGNAIRSYAKAMHMYDKLGRQGVPPLYHGDVVLFRATEAEPDSPILVEIYDAAPQFKDAWKSVNSERSMDNAAFWRQYYPNMEIHNMQAHHMSMLEGRYAQTYVEWLDNYLKNHQSSK